MSTADLSISAWIQSENTLDYGPAWTALREQERPDRQDADSTEHAASGEPAPGLPNDFWQGWFGLFT